MPAPLPTARGGPLVTRHANNPIPTGGDVPYPVESVHNAGVVKHPEGRYVMLFRRQLRSGRSIIGLAESDDGFRFQVHRNRQRE